MGAVSQPLSQTARLESHYWRKQRFAVLLPFRDCCGYRFRHGLGYDALRTGSALDRRCNLSRQRVGSASRTPDKIQPEGFHTIQHDYASDRRRFLQVRAGIVLFPPGRRVRRARARRRWHNDDRSRFAKPGDIPTTPHPAMNPLGCHVDATVANPRATRATDAPKTGRDPIHPRRRWRNVASFPTQQFKPGTLIVIPNGKAHGRVIVASGPVNAIPLDPASWRDEVVSATDGMKPNSEPG